MLPDFPLGSFKPPFTILNGECGSYVIDKSNSTVLSTTHPELAEFVASYGNFIDLHQDWSYKSAE